MNRYRGIQPNARIRSIHTSMATDIDECCLGQDNCDPNSATCTNTIGSFECECLPGFTGDGVTCEGQLFLVILG